MDKQNLNKKLLTYAILFRKLLYEEPVKFTPFIRKVFFEATR